ncbi:hypothetical protein V2J09_021675 [Rumex salicifolius]
MDVDEDHEDLQNDPGISSYIQVPDIQDGSGSRTRIGAAVHLNDSPPGDPMGTWSKGFRRACRYLLSKYKSDVLILLEPQVSGTKAQEVCDSLGFSDNVRIEATGAAGGIWVLWNASSTDLQVVLENQNFIHVKVKCARTEVHFIFVYGPPTPARRSSFWRDVEAVINGISAPLFVGGDFNCILSMEERWGGSGGLSQDSPTFADLVDRLDLIDLGFSGSRFTWRRGPSEAPTVAKRLDRFFTNVIGRIGWEEAVVRHLPAIRSDHNPLFLCLDPSSLNNRGHRPFRFEAMWLAHPQFMSFLLKKWKREKAAPDALGCLQKDLRIWNKEVFGNLYYKKEKLLRRIEGIDNAIASGGPPRLLHLQSKLKRDLEDCLQQEEMFWFQKSREKWVELGDRNTAYFHASTIIRRRRKYVLALKDHAENRVVEKPDLENMVVTFFKDLYSLPSDASCMNLPRGGFPSIPCTDLLRLGVPFTDEEIRAAFHKMGAYKAPGVDGFQPVFYQKCWDVVRESVCTFIKEFFSTGHLPTGANETLIHLIGKVDSPELVSQFRPISLCNVLYKAITKILRTRLRPIMEYVVSPLQSSFIPGRFITDNVLLAQELVHSMRRKSGRKGWFLLKLDLEKAYDRLRIRWNVGDGSKIRFWLDHWLDGGPLINQVVSMPPVDMLGTRVCDFWEPDGGWAWGQFSNFLPASCLMRLCAVVVRHGPNVADMISWAYSRDGEYSTKSAYLSLKQPPFMETELCDIFRRIWRLRVSERIRMFLWMGVHGKLMTNAERFRRHFASSPACSICGRGDETLLHIFRDCGKARDVWRALVDNRIMSDYHFFDKSAKEWLNSGIRGEFEILPLIPNEAVFAVVLWWLWRWRNDRVFNSDNSIGDIRSFIQEQAKEFAASTNGRRVDAMVGRREEIHISWSRPAVGWVKVNTDGARESRYGMATAGGVIRNDEGRWMGGFVKNIGVCSVPCAELWDIYHGLELAWESGCKFVIVESDSSTTITFMNRRVSVHHPLSSLVLACQSFISRNWVVQFRHCYREANRVADHLASLAFDFPAGCHVFSSPIASVISLLSDDDRGVSLSRLVQTL